MDLWSYLSTVKKDICLYGMGDGAEKIYARLKEVGVTPAGVFASDGFARHNEFLGYEVIPYSVAKEKHKDMIVLVCFGSALPNVLEQIKNVGEEFELYIPDVPVYGEGTFNQQYYKEHLDEINMVYNLLADEQSKYTFNSIIEYKLSGKPKPLFAGATPYDEVYKNIITLSDDEVFIDLGAYKGDTVLDFLNRAGGNYSNIIAVEPDRKIYKKLIEATINLKNFTAYNAAVSDAVGTVMFSMKGGRNSSACAGGGIPIKAITVDKICKNCSPTFIKFDVEGAEKPAILGAKGTILTHKPKMQIAAYHRNEDIFDIPLTVNSIRDDYKIYIRRNPCIPAWDVNYYFV